MDQEKAKYEEFIYLLDSFFKQGYSNKEIADEINISISHLSKIKTKNKNVSDKILSRMRHKINPKDKKQYLLFDNINLFEDNKNDSNKGLYKLDSILEKYTKMYEGKIAELKATHEEEISILNSIIDNLRFIIERYEKDQGK